MDKVIDINALRQSMMNEIDDLDRLWGQAQDSCAPVTLDQQSVGRLSRMDALQGQAMQLETERRRDIERQRIQAALERIETGDYGFCTICDEDIALKRLENDPSAPNCIDCQRRLEQEAS